MVAGRDHPVMKQPFMVTCDDCPFEQAVGSRAAAEAVAQQHLDDSGHDVFAVEMPRL